MFIIHLTKRMQIQIQTEPNTFPQLAQLPIYDWIHHLHMEASLVLGKK